MFINIIGGSNIEHNRTIFLCKHISRNRGNHSFCNRSCNSIQLFHILKNRQQSNDLRTFAYRNKKGYGTFSLNSLIIRYKNSFGPDRFI